jgi:preprotein translocase subunit SecA
MKKGFLKKLFGSKSDRDYKRHGSALAEVNRFAEEYQSFTESDFPKKTEEFKTRIRGGEPLDSLLPEAYGLVKAGCKYLVGKSWDVCGIDVKWEMVPYDVQIVGGISLNSGSISEMATGEGKTLVATMPLYLNALAGRGVHLITVNDYLARRDAEWMGRVYELLGLTVGCIQGDMGNEERKAAYEADITYGTNNEFGFDYLRDNMKTRLEDRVQPDHFYCIVDEVDSVLIDEARTPLIISGPVTASESSELYGRLRPKVEKMVSLQDRLVNSLLSMAEKEMDNADLEDEVAQALLKVSRANPKNSRFLKIKKEPGVARMIARMEADLMREKRLHELDEQL